MRPGTDRAVTGGHRRSSAGPVSPRLVWSLVRYISFLSQPLYFGLRLVTPWPVGVARWPLVAARLSFLRLLSYPFMQHFIDLSHTITDGLITYQGLPAPEICDFWTRAGSAVHYAEGTSFHIARIDMVGNTGTYLDAPYHRYAEGADIAGLELARLVNLPTEVIQANGEEVKAIDAEYFMGLELRDKAVLVHTGWDQHWGEAGYFANHPFLTEDAAAYLVAEKVALVGIDANNIDDTRGKTRPVHSLLLGAGIPIVEHLCRLDQIPDRAVRFSAVPPRIVGMGSFPVRAYVWW